MPLFELLIGVFATPDDLDRTAQGLRAALHEASVPYQLSVHDQERATTGDPDMTLAELYDELPLQWDASRPDAASTLSDEQPRRVHEFRIGVLLPPRHSTDPLLDTLTRALCPDPDHADPCPVPWSCASTDGGPDGHPEHRERLRAAYGHLAPAGS